MLKMTHVTMRLVCSKYRINIGLIVNTVGKAYVVTWKVRIFHFHLHFYISNLIMKLDMTIFVIHKLLTRQFPIQSNPMENDVNVVKVLTSLRYKNLGHLDFGCILIIKGTLINKYTPNKTTSTRQSCAIECRIGGTWGCYWPWCNGHHH